MYPVSFIWHSDFWSTATNILKDALQRRKPEGILSNSLDFMLNRLDDALEPLARTLTGKASWSEMKENAVQATTNQQGGARFALNQIAELAQNSDVELHVVGHSAGSIFLAPLVRLLTAPQGTIMSGYLTGERGYGLSVESLTLWAPACTTALFKDAYLEAIQKNRIKRPALFTLTNKAEEDDNCAQIYHKSLLYLVSNAFETNPRIPFSRRNGESILGMEKFLGTDQELKKLLDAQKIDWVVAPNTAPDGSRDCSTAHHHGDFDDDKPTVKATLARILNQPQDNVQDTLTFYHSSSSLRETRQQLVTQ